MKRTPQVGDYIKTISKRYPNGPWRGKIVRTRDESFFESRTYLIEWRSTGVGYTDILTWVNARDIEVVRRPKVQNEKRKNFRCMQCDKLTSGYAVRKRFFHPQGWVNCCVCIKCSKEID